MNQPVLDRIADLRRLGYRTGLLTNSFREFRDHLESRVDFGLFDVVIDSSEVGLRKPEPAIYDLATRRLEADPSSILYVDDFEANVDAGRAAGWATIHFRDVSTALAELDELLAAA